MLPKEGGDVAVALLAPRHGPSCPGTAASEKFTSEGAALLDLFIFAHVCGLRCVLRKGSCCLKALYF